ncbi:MAG: pyrroline-5-carboxylate reductase [Bdellovibrionales bacterium]|nr:pyrroline-5-carboxylate reductase [Bdellovibrionales bacterium]
MDTLMGKKIGFLGCGNMSVVLMSSMIQSGAVDPQQVWASNRSPRKLENAVQSLGIQKAANNDELLEKCDIIVIAVKPQDYHEAIEPIASQFEEDHIIVSLAAGISLDSMKRLFFKSSNLIRVMPNTPVKIGKGVLGLTCAHSAQHLLPLMENLFSGGGYIVKVEEGEPFEAVTVGAGSGVGFVFELMLYWQEWLEEHGLSREEARQVTVQTFLGASELALQSSSLSLDELQRKVVSKKGVTAAGLDSMRELEIERAIRYSFEKAVLRDRDLGKS